MKKYLDELFLSSHLSSPFLLSNSCSHICNDSRLVFEFLFLSRTQRDSQRRMRRLLMFNSTADSAVFVWVVSQPWHCLHMCLYRPSEAYMCSPHVCFFYNTYKNIRSHSLIIVISAGFIRFCFVLMLTTPDEDYRQWEGVFPLIVISNTHPNQTESPSARGLLYAIHHNAMLFFKILEFRGIIYLTNSTTLCSCSKSV